MEETRDLSTLVFFEGMQSHSSWQPAFSEFERWLKLFSLFHSGVVIADSDVNNHPVLNALVGDAGGRRLLADAIRSGCMRRAVRRQGAGLMSQVDLYEQLRKRSPERAAEVHPETPGWMEDRFVQAEEDGTSVPWTLESLAEAFRTRLMMITRVGRGLSPKLATVARAICDHAERLPDGPLSAAQIEDKFKLREPERAPLRQRVHQAYTGNLPAAFDGRLISAASGTDIAWALPAGPDAEPAEQEVLAAWYESRIEKGHTNGFQLSRSPLSVSPTPSFSVDLDALMAMSFAQIVDLRRTSKPDRYFSLRHSALGAPKELARLADELLAERQAFLSRIEGNGRMQLRRSLDRRPPETMHLRVSAGGDRLLGEPILAGVVVPGLGEVTALLASPARTHRPVAISLRRTNTRVLNFVRRRLAD